MRREISKLSNLQKKESDTSLERGSNNIQKREQGVPSNNPNSCKVPVPYQNGVIGKLAISKMAFFFGPHKHKAS